MSRYYGKMRSSFDSEGASSGISPPQSPPRHPVYFVQSPSRDSHDEKPSIHSTPVMSPMASPLHHQSFIKHSGSLQSEASSVPPAPKPGSRRVLPHVPSHHRGGGGGGHKKGGYKQWVPGTIMEEEEQLQGESDKRKPLSRCCMCWLSLLFCICLLAFVGLIFWLVCHPHAPKLEVKRIQFHEFTVVPGSEDGVPTRVLSSNCTVMINFKNPSQYFGLHVRATDFNLAFGDLPVATGKMDKFYQKKGSARTFPVNVEAIKVPLYGAGPSLEQYTSGGGDVPLQIVAGIRSIAHVFPFVKPKFRSAFVCDFKVHTSQLKFLDVVGNKCLYNPK